MRPSNRALDEMRSIEIETNVTRHAEGSCLIKVGDTHVLCTASVDERVPPSSKDLASAGSQQNMVCCPVQHTHACAAKPKTDNPDAPKKFNA